MRRLRSRVRHRHDIFASMLQSVKTPQRTHPPLHAGKLEELVVNDHRGTSVRLGDLWREQPVVLVFLRHYG
jgi:hypothetical protein